MNVKASRSRPARSTRAAPPATAGPTLAELRAMYAACRRFLGGHGYRSAAEQLAVIPSDTTVDMDGARLWMCAGFYERPLDAIATLFDTVYVSFYKDIGALSGAAVAGPADVIAEVREWRQRHGGTLFTMWPHAASALANLRLRLPRMPAYRAQALALATALADLPGVDVVPALPQTSMFHLVLHRDVDALQAAALRLAKDDGIGTASGVYSTDVPGVSRVELSVGDATLEWTPAEFRSVIGRLLGG